jgi:hypothetical protein
MTAADYLIFLKKYVVYFSFRSDKNEGLYNPKKSFYSYCRATLIYEMH